MEDIIFQPHARNPTMPIERQPTIRFNQPTVSTSTWADVPDDELSPDELMEVLNLDNNFPIQFNPSSLQVNTTSPTISEESGSTETVGPPAKSPRQNPIFNHIPKHLSGNHHPKGKQATKLKN